MTRYGRYAAVIGCIPVEVVATMFFSGIYLGKADSDKVKLVVLGYCKLREYSENGATEMEKIRFN